MPSAWQVFHELSCRFQLDALVDVVKNLLVTRLKPDQQQAQTVVPQLLERVVIEVGASIAAPGELEPLHVFANRDRPLLVDRKGIVVKHVFLDTIAKNRFGFVQFSPYYCRTFCAVLVSTDRLRPKAKATLRRTPHVLCRTRL